MKMNINCPVCGKVLAVLEKDSISQDDISLYEQMVACDVDGPVLSIPQNAVTDND